MDYKDTVMPLEYSVLDGLHCAGISDEKILRALGSQAEISFKAGEKQARWDVGEELCCLIGNLMLEDMEAGKLLGNQLEGYMREYLKEWGIK